MELAKKGREAILEKMKEMGFGCIILSPTETPLGVVETYQDAKKCAELFAKHREEIDGIIIVLPNFGDEAAVTEAIVRAGLRVPVLVQACDDEKDKLDLSHRRDSFCGKLSVCNNLYQNRIPFTDTTYHTCSIDSREFCRNLQSSAGVKKSESWSYRSQTVSLSYSQIFGKAFAGSGDYGGNHRFIGYFGFSRGKNEGFPC